MQYTKAHGDEAQDKIWLHVTNGQLAGGGALGPAISAGDVCVWDSNDNRAVAGLTRETRGFRVIQLPAGVKTALTGEMRAGVAEIAIPVLAAANQQRNDCFLMQVSGFHPGVTWTGTASALWRRACVSDTAGSAEEAGSLTPALVDLNRTVGAMISTTIVGGKLPLILRGFM